MKILITGSLGLVGSEAFKFFRDKGWEVVGIDNNTRSVFFGTEKGEQGDSIDIDIRDERTINNLFRECKFDAIIHTAAQPSHDWSQKEPMTDFDVNARGTLILLEATRKYCPNATFVHISTDKVYGENMNCPIIEKETRFNASYEVYGKGFDEKLDLDFAGNRSLFGCSKTAADIYVQEYGNYFGMKTVCFRLGCITGRNHKGAELHGFMSYLVKCIKEGKPYNIFGYKGKQVRDQIHAYDLVTACYEFIQNPKVAAVYNLGGGPDRSLSVLEAGEMISEELDKPFVYNYVDKPRKGDRIWDIHDVSKFQKDYPGWKYKYSLQDIMKDLCT